MTPPQMPTLGTPRVGTGGCFAPFQGTVWRSRRRRRLRQTLRGTAREGASERLASSDFRTLGPVCVRSARAGPREAYTNEQIDRRQRVELGGVGTYVITAEDTIVSKMRWSKLSESDRQLSDCAGIVRVQDDWTDPGAPGPTTETLFHDGELVETWEFVYDRVR